MKCLKPYSFAPLKFLVSCFVASGFASAANIVIPAQTTIPIIFSHTVDSRKANPGDTVTAKTLQVIELPSGRAIPKNSIVLGRIVDVQPSAKNGSNSRLSIQFESIRVKNETIQIRVSVRALASPNESYDATHPTGPVDGDVLDTTTLIGGDYFYLSDKHLYSPGGDALVKAETMESSPDCFLPNTITDTEAFFAAVRTQFNLLASTQLRRAAPMDLATRT